MPTIIPDSPSEPSEVRRQILDDVHNIIRTSHISRGAVMSSTPEQIVWMTQKAIAENLWLYANGEDSNNRWYAREGVLGSVIKRELREIRGLTPKAIALAEMAVDRAVEEWPS